MAQSELTISKVGRESDEALRNLFEHYLRDMAEWFEVDSYDTSLIWERGYDAYLANVGDAIAGFALAGTHEGANDIAEFFILRTFRREGRGQRMATLVWNKYPGEWLVRVLEMNRPAVLFWRQAIEGYTGGFYKEEGRMVKGREWRFFRFVSRGD